MGSSRSGNGTLSFPSFARTSRHFSHRRCEGFLVGFRGGEVPSLVLLEVTDFRSTAEARAHRDYPTPPLTTAACCGGEVSLGELRVVGVVVVVVCAAVQVGWRGVPRRNWPGGGNGTDPSGGIASPARGRTRPAVSLPIFCLIRGRKI